MLNANEIKSNWSAWIKPRVKRGARLGYASRGGFTLIEVMLASAISLLLLMSLLETLSACRRMAANVKWRLAADALAYDTAWAYFNEQTTWFDEHFPEAQAKWETVPAARTSVWLDQQRASLYWSVTPVGVPTTKWVIRTNVQWPLPNGGFSKLPNDYVIERYRADRNLFRAKL
jgi:prepilin-type N-terminal cleavage/methylation domain-containing protein